MRPLRRAMDGDWIATDGVGDRVVLIASAKEMLAGRTQLYRHFDAEGTLLYVGISLSVLHRLAQHRSHAEWFDEITDIKVQHFPTRAEALIAEKIAIQTEGPKYNKQYKLEAAS